MTMAVNMITINTVVAAGDTKDLERLATFLLAFSRTDLSERGAIGACKIQPYKHDYKAVFDNGCVLTRGTDSHTVLFRQTTCPVTGCGVRTLSVRYSEMCRGHWNEMHGEMA